MTRAQANAIIEALVDFLDARRAYNEVSAKAFRNRERDWEYLHRGVVDAEKEAREGLIVLLMRVGEPS